MASSCLARFLLPPCTYLILFLLQSSQDSFKFYFICTCCIIFVAFVRRESTFETRCCRRKFFQFFSHYTSSAGTVCQVNWLWQAKWVRGRGAQLSRNKRCTDPFIRVLTGCAPTNNVVGFVERMSLDESTMNSYWITEAAGVHNW
jgi:hypothetical protein